MQWIRDNWLKTGILICGIAIAYSFYNYLVITPKKNQQQKETEAFTAKQENCRKLGAEYSEKYKKELDSNPLSMAIISPVYHYNQTLSSCLVETGANIYYTTGNYSTYKFIVNLQTNVKLAEISYDEETKIKFPDDYMQKDKYYFEQKAELFELPELPKLPATNQ